MKTNIWSFSFHNKEHHSEMDLTFTLLTKHHPTHTPTQTLATPTDHRMGTAMEATSPEHS